MEANTTPVPPKKLLDQVRDKIRYKHYSLNTEDTYLSWIKQFEAHRSRSMRLLMSLSYILELRPTSLLSLTYEMVFSRMLRRALELSAGLARQGASHGCGALTEGQGWTFWQPPAKARSKRKSLARRCDDRH